MSVNLKMTALANEVRTLSGSDSSIKKSIEAMTKDVKDANTEIGSQVEKINEIITALEGKAAGGGTAYNHYDFVKVNSLSEVTSIAENTIYTLPDNKQYIAAMSALSGTDEPTGQYYLVPCYLTTDQYGSDAPMAIVDPTAIVPTEVQEQWFSGDAEFDVTTAATFIAHTPQIFFETITNLDQVTDPNTLYNLNDNENYMLAMNSAGNYTAAKAQMLTDINGFDAVVPLIDTNGGESSEIPTFTLNLTNNMSCYVYVPTCLNGVISNELFQESAVISNAVAGGFITLVDCHNGVSCDNGLSEFAYSDYRGSSGITVVSIDSSLAGSSTTLEVW
jgi:hypothetical protein